MEVDVKAEGRKLSDTFLRVGSCQTVTGSFQTKTGICQTVTGSCQTKTGSCQTETGSCQTLSNNFKSGGLEVVSHLKTKEEMCLTTSILRLGSCLSLV